MKTLILVLGLVAASLMVGYFVLKQKEHKPPFALSSNTTQDLGTISDFNFLDQNGKPFGLKKLIGKTWIADFIFTRCMGPCPVVTHEMAELQKKFSNRPDIRFVSFSVDPEFDKPAVLSRYASTYGADEKKWAFLTGDKKKIYELIQNHFRLAIGQESDANFIHSLHFVWVDPEAKIKGYYNSTNPNDIEKLIQALNK